jgi:hypothetical protein
MAGAEKSVSSVSMILLDASARVLNSLDSWAV